MQTQKKRDAQEAKDKIASYEVMVLFKIQITKNELTKSVQVVKR